MALSLEMDTGRYVKLMEKLIGEVEHLQNNPPRFVPQEDRAIKHLKEALEPYSKEKGGPLNVRHITYVEGRGNLILEYNPKGLKETVAFVGSHLDVVPANPETWERNPFKLFVEGDKLYGRGTTDCLGHVAMVTEAFIQLAEKKPDLKFGVVAVFIACEENATIQGVGVDKLMEMGELDFLKNGPVYWVDSADCNPCIGTASCLMWTMKFKGHLFHSGLPHKGINSFELAMDALTYIQERFYKDFPPHPKEAEYKFATPSTMKPTQVCCSEGSVNQLPPWTEVKGDIRLTPFYNIHACIEKVKGYIADINNDLSLLNTRGPCSRYDITVDGKNLRGKIEFSDEGAPFKGIACNLGSLGHKYLDQATKEVYGTSEPFSICGSLPLVGDLQEAGYDVQVCGYGHSAVYHGDNEYCTLSQMEKALKVISRLLDLYNQ